MRKQNHQTHNDFKASPRSGVTILEVLIVLAVIALIAAVVGPRLIGYLGKAKSDTAELQIKQIGNAVKLFYIDVGRYPTSSESLSVLMQAPPSESDWQGPYLENASGLVDPWGRDYVYKISDQSSSFDIISYGLDGVPGGTGEDRDLSLK